MRQCKEYDVKEAKDEAARKEIQAHRGSANQATGRIQE